MLDIKFIRENPEIVKENIRKKFKDHKLPLVDEVIELDAKRRAAIVEADSLRSSRNTLSKQIGMLMGQAKKDPSKLAEAEEVKAQVKANADRLAELEKLEGEMDEAVRKIMLQIPNIIDPSVPIGESDEFNVEVEVEVEVLGFLKPVKRCPPLVYGRTFRTFNFLRLYLFYLWQKM